MAHVHHSHKGADLVEAAKATMEKSGEQWTQMRSAVFGALGLGTMAGSLTLHHGTEEVIYSVFGVLLLALGHDLNRRAVI